MKSDAHVLLVCPNEHRELACHDAAKLSGNPADARPEFFSKPAKPRAGLTCTHHYTVTAIRSAALAALPALAVKYEGAVWALLEEGMSTENHTVHEHWRAALERLGYEQWVAPEIVLEQAAELARADAAEAEKSLEKRREDAVEKP